MPIQVWVDTATGIRKYFTNVIHLTGGTVLLDNGGSTGVVKVTPGGIKTIFVTWDGQPDNELGAGHIAKILPIDVDGTLVAVRIVSDVICTTAFSIWKDVYANGDPTVADNIVGSTAPGLTASKYYQDTVLTGWNKVVNKNDMWLINIASITTGVKYLQLELVIQL